MKRAEESRRAMLELKVRGEMASTYDCGVAWVCRYLCAKMEVNKNDERHVSLFLRSLSFLQYTFESFHL